MPNPWGKAIGCAQAGMLLCSLTTAAADPPVALSWRLIENLPDNRYRAELELHNHGPNPLVGDWQIFFNCSSRLAPDSVSADFLLTHINGDFYSLRPAENAPPLTPDETHTIRYEGAPWAINLSDAPSGFYMILRDEAGNEATPIPLTLAIEPFPPRENITRGAADRIPVVTPQSRYRENESLLLLPEATLPRVVPTPIATKQLPGHVILSPSTEITFDKPLASEAKFLAARLEQLLGQSLRLAESSTPSTNAIRLRLGDQNAKAPARAAKTESYTLIIDPERGIEITAADPAGVFYGVQTLLALIPIEAYRTPARELALDAVRIEDAPRFVYRGLHLDVARNFQSKQMVKKLLDVMAFYKLNRLHWHLTDDEGWRVVIRALPELTEVGGRRGHTRDELDHLIPSLGSGPFPDPAFSPGSGFYTQDDFIEILRYAAERHIQVIPELDFPGHARAAIKSMQARHRRLMDAGNRAAADEFLLTEPGDESKYESVQMWRDNVVDVGRDATYRFLDVVVGELADMYRRAGLDLKVLHLGGDEIPDGAWEASPAAARIPVDSASKVSRSGQLQLHFLNRASEILAKHGIRPACWEDCLLMTFDVADSSESSSGLAALEQQPIAYVWNNVWGWGREDAAYRLANAGYDVVLANATHLYFDLAYEKHPAEIGYYWAGFVDARAPFELNPLNVFQNAEHNGMGQPITAESLIDRTRLTHQGRRRILGIQGQLWSENLRSAAALDYMAVPKLISLAERAWAQAPSWAEVEDANKRRDMLQRHWNQFANQLGQHELPRLDWQFGGVQYRLPPPGAIVRDGKTWANVEYPGLAIHYTTGGDEPTSEDVLYQAPIEGVEEIRLKTFDTRGRGSRTVTPMD